MLKGNWGRMYRGGVTRVMVVTMPLLGLLSGCAPQAPLRADASGPTSSIEAAPDGWENVALPGKQPTRYVWDVASGQSAWRADSVRSASMWRKRLSVPASDLRQIEFAWRVDQLIPDAIVADAGQDDAPARILVAFDGDHAKLSLRNRMLFDLADTLTGERPPYATLMYVWADAKSAPETVLISQRSDRIRKIVVDTGSQHLGHWRRHRRDLVADFLRAFGEPPGDVIGVALMTDSDNTGSAAQAWYGDIRFGALAVP